MQDTSTHLATKQAEVKPPNVQDIRLIVVDLDGTTVGETNQIRPAVKAAIQAARDKGVEVAIATGRMYQSALRFYNDLQLTSPLMTYQGALIKDPASGQVHQHLTVPRSYVAQLLEFLGTPELQSLVSVHLYIDDRLYVREINAETIAYAERSEVEPVAVGDLRQVLDTEPTKLLALSQEIDLIDRLFGSLQKRYTPAELYLTKSVATFLEATHPLVNKGNAVQYLAEEILGLRPENVMTIGDNFNDLEMLQYAGLGVAMGGAPAGVKAVADWVAPDVEADGVAAAIAEFVLIGTEF
ncbi:Cof-type HAD-IIB family hydrolase [Thermocoleostomius sinensis A174]|uniref:Cof-type HAD-IIB family hydrolase n=2 Tax=Thermocoleostomius TaxID=3065395 RepID=A0A9E8ZKF9_9CYAN|nr:Cof-type HAD-IIB family hydrolase [Thermocoleostomius sinensis A174]